MAAVQGVESVEGCSFMPSFASDDGDSDLLSAAWEEIPMMIGDSKLDLMSRLAMPIDAVKSPLDLETELVDLAPLDILPVNKTQQEKESASIASITPTGSAILKRKFNCEPHVSPRGAKKARKSNNNLTKVFETKRAGALLAIYDFMNKNTLNSVGQKAFTGPERKNACGFFILLQFLRNQLGDDSKDFEVPRTLFERKWNKLCSRFLHTRAVNFVFNGDFFKLLHKLENECSEFVDFVESFPPNEQKLFVDDCKFRLNNCSLLFNLIRDLLLDFAQKQQSNEQ